MKKYEVIYKRETTELTKPYGSSDTYYDVNGRKCYSVEVSEETLKDIVFATQKKTILKTYANGVIFVESIKEIGEETFQFEALAGDDYMKVEKGNEVINVKYIGQRDKECAPEVQEEYQRTGELNPLRPMSDW